MISDVGADEKSGVVIHLLESGDHFKKVIQRLGFAAQHAAGVFDPRIFRQYFRDVIRDGTIFNARTLEYVADQHVEIKVGRDTQTTALFQKGTEQALVVQDQIARRLVRQQFDEAVVGVLRPEDSENKLN